MPKEIADVLSGHSPWLLSVFLILGGLNGLASILEHVVETLPHGLPGWQGTTIGIIRWVIATIQYILECVIAKRSKPHLLQSEMATRPANKHEAQHAEYLSYRCPGRLPEGHPDVGSKDG